MEKRFIVRLDEVERVELEQVVSKLSGCCQKVRRANMLLQADANGQGGPTNGSLKLIDAEPRLWRMSGNGSSSGAFEKHSREDIPRIRRGPNYWMANRRQRSSLLGWVNRQRATRIGL